MPTLRKADIAGALALESKIAQSGALKSVSVTPELFKKDGEPIMPTENVEIDFRTKPSRTNPLVIVVRLDTFPIKWSGEPALPAYRLDTHADSTSRTQAVGGASGGGASSFILPTSP